MASESSAHDAARDVDAADGGGIDRDALDRDAIAHALSPSARDALAALDVVASIDSTNSELLRRDIARNGASVLFAEQQTGGRGRQGRAWVSPPACNLYLSIARHFAGPVSRLGGLSIAVGVATAEALRGLGLSDVGLKWPNDVAVVDGGALRKLGGILIESGGARDGAVRAVIGLGLNVRMSDIANAATTPTQTKIAAIDQPWTDLRARLGARTPARNVIAAATLDALLPALDAFERDGLGDAVARYARYDVLRGRAVSWDDGACEGVAEGLDDDGALRVRTADGALRALRAGDVRVRPRIGALPYRP